MADKYEQYGHVVGMLGALALTTRPDLAYAVGQVRQYTAFPRRHHYQALKRIVRYVKGTIHYGIVFSKDASSKITGYVDADHATNKDDRTSISGTVFLFMGAAIVYRSKKQRVAFWENYETERRRKTERRKLQQTPLGRRPNQNFEHWTWALGMHYGFGKWQRHFGCRMEIQPYRSMRTTNLVIILRKITSGPVLRNMWQTCILQCGTTSWMNVLICVLLIQKTILPTCLRRLSDQFASRDFGWRSGCVTLRFNRDTEMRFGGSAYVSSISVSSELESER